MIKRRLQILGIAALALPLCAQEPATPGPKPRAANETKVPSASADDLPRFDLNFLGGSPKDLVAIINQALSAAATATGSDSHVPRTVNVIIPDDARNTKIPPISVKNVDVASLFHAVSMAGNKTLTFRDEANSLHLYSAGYSFTTEDRPARPNSIWYFLEQKPAGWRQETNAVAKDCRFYQLAPYLETHKVEDITTAVETAWQMLGESNPPTFSFHKDTKLLIAVGEKRDLAVIDNVLHELTPARPPAPAAPADITGTPAKPSRQ